jgi:hypothetical protein
MTELGPEARAILDAGRAGDDPTPADRDRMRGRVLRAVAVGVAATAASTATEVAAAAAPKGAALFSVAWKVMLGVVTAGAVYVAVASPPGKSSSEDRAPALSTTTAAVAKATSSPEPKAAEASPAPSSPQQASDPAASKSPTAPVAKVDPPKPVPGREASKAPEAPKAPEASPSPAADLPTPAPANSLDAETRKLGEAERALQGGDPARALSMIDEQSATYQSGQLREEREAARIFALCKLGRTAEAEAARAAFLRDHPHAPTVDRVRAACGGASKP